MQEQAIANSLKREITYKIFNDPDYSFSKDNSPLIDSFSFNMSAGSS